MNGDKQRPTAVEIVERERVYSGYFKIDRLRLRHELYQGGMGKEVLREVAERGHAVAVMLYDPDRDAAVMIEQFRPGAHAAGWDAWLLEVVAGIIEDGESALDVARRECMEEAGVAIDEFVEGPSYLASPGVLTESISLFIGRVDSSRCGGIHGLGEEGEDIRVVVLPLDELRRRVEAHALTNATSLIAAQYLLLNRDTLRARWGIS
ncbi:NUDIX domain-containing protein [Novispirillum sp. DQ9]|uniref:NUDIX domain-containing protein n=1 Tax=Novispirillum sp. DQ9 TaxID=3398612 RepID=UPI003C7A99F5